jgi:hypothetical protein
VIIVQLEKCNNLGLTNLPLPRRGKFSRVYKKDFAKDKEFK